MQREVNPGYCLLHRPATPHLPGCRHADSPAWASYWRGKQRRRAGRYDPFTLVCLRHAWRRRPGLRTLLAYLGCRRDFGCPPHPALLDSLAGYLPQARGHALHRAANLLLESGRHNGVLESADSAALLALAPHSPPLARHLLQSGRTLDGSAGLLAQLQAAQEDWRTEFGHYLRARQPSICVVGNAGTLQGTGFGPRIDAQRCVIRFNHPAGTAQPQDHGSRTDVWVRAPDLATREHSKDGDPPGWVVLSGCDVRYQLYVWDELTALLAAGQRVITVPAGVWRTLVRVLQAPPSAGVLMLAWLIELLGDAGGIMQAGFQDDRHPARATRRACCALPWPRTGSRHNWRAELAWLRHCRAHGLSALTAR